MATYFLFVRELLYKIEWPSFVHVLAFRARITIFCGWGNSESVGLGESDWHWSLLGYNTDNKKQLLTVLIDVKKSINVTTLVNLVQNVLICLMQSLLVDENKTCRQENNWIGYSSVDTNIKNWTDWYGSHPRISEVTDHIMSWWPVLPAAWGGLSVIFRWNAST